MTAISAGQKNHAMLNEDAHFFFPQADAYWSYFAFEERYEPEIAWLLRRASQRPYDFLDGGANFGYWSIIASSAPYGSHRTVAIEASRANFELLVENAEANRNRFAALHRAIFDQTGKQVTLYGKKHYGLSLRKEWHPDDGDQFETVETVTLDDVADRYFPNPKHPPFVKIDVEGSEIEAMKGAQRLFDGGALFVYEDHGKEVEHSVSRYALSLRDVEIRFVDTDQRMIRIWTLEQIGAIKQSPKQGYNFFGCKRSSPWTSLFED